MLMYVYTSHCADNIAISSFNWHKDRIFIFILVITLGLIGISFVSYFLSFSNKHSLFLSTVSFNGFKIYNYNISLVWNSSIKSILDNIIFSWMHIFNSIDNILHVHGVEYTLDGIFLMALNVNKNIDIMDFLSLRLTTPFIQECSLNVKCGKFWFPFL